MADSMNAPAEPRSLEPTDDYEELFRHAPVLYFVVKGGGIIENANETAASFFGSRREALIGRNVDTLVDHGDRKKLHAHLRRARRDDEVISDVFSFRGRPLQMTSMRRAHSGDRIVCRCALSDVGRLQEECQRATLLAAVSRALLDNLDEKRLVRSLVQSLVPTFADACAVDVAHTRTERSAVDDRSEAALQRLASGALPARPVLVPDCGDGASLIVAPVALFTASAAATPLAALTLVRASSGRRFGQEDLVMATTVAQSAAAAIHNCRRHEALHDSLRSRDRVLAMVSHDLRNALNVLTLGFESSADPHDTGSHRRTRRQLDALKRSVVRMDRLVNDLLDFASIEAGRLAIFPERVPLRHLIEEALETAAPHAEARKVALSSDAVGDNFVVHCDRGRIHQVLTNLITNGVKFTDPGGSVVVRCEAADPKTALVSISDTGCGIDGELIRDLFKPYVQAQSTARLGHGLGLYIARALIDAHGGRLSVRSEPGVGSVFAFTLPFALDA